MVLLLLPPPLPTRPAQALIPPLILTLTLTLLLTLILIVLHVEVVYTKVSPIFTSHRKI